MKRLTLEVPDRLADQLTQLVKEGWFGSEAELARAALLEFLRHHSWELAESFQREDIAWARQLKTPAG
ncbi:MAG: ribbon-helix-helix domain-containing protein [Thermoanaerobaculia bacterium]